MILAGRALDYRAAGHLVVLDGRGGGLAGCAVVGRGGSLSG